MKSCLLFVLSSARQNFNWKGGGPPGPTPGYSSLGCVVEKDATLFKKDNSFSKLSPTKLIKVRENLSFNLFSPFLSVANVPGPGVMGGLDMGSHTATFPCKKCV